MKELNPIYRHTFHVPAYSLRDDIITIRIYDYDAVTKCDLIGKLEFKIKELSYGLVRDEWYNIGKGKIHLLTHFSDENQPSFEEKIFNPYFLNIKILETKEVSIAERQSLSVHMKNDIYGQIVAMKPKMEQVEIHPQIILEKLIQYLDSSFEKYHQRINRIKY